MSEPHPAAGGGDGLRLRAQPAEPLPARVSTLHVRGTPASEAHAPVRYRAAAFCQADVVSGVFAGEPLDFEVGG